MTSDFLIVKNCIYAPCLFECSFPLVEAESSEYGACAFTLNGLSVLFRTAKITPTKVGQFVSVWKRIPGDTTRPCDESDNIDFFVINVRMGNHFGQFVFPKSILLEKDIMSQNSKGGKRGARVYPPWDLTTNKQAIQTQKWQLNYFLDIPENQEVNMGRARLLYGLK